MEARLNLVVAACNPYFAQNLSILLKKFPVELPHIVLPNEASCIYLVQKLIHELLGMPPNWPESHPIQRGVFDKIENGVIDIVYYLLVPQELKVDTTFFHWVKLSDLNDVVSQRNNDMIRYALV